VRPGLTDGATSEVEGEGLTEGLEVVAGVEMQSDGRTDANNPFVPQFPGRSRSSGAR
jgi:hypothetical protein